MQGYLPARIASNVREGREQCCRCSQDSSTVAGARSSRPALRGHDTACSCSMTTTAPKGKHEPGGAPTPRPADRTTRQRSEGRRDALPPRPRRMGRCRRPRWSDRGAPGHRCQRGRVLAPGGTSARRVPRGHPRGGLPRSRAYGHPSPTSRTGASCAPSARWSRYPRSCSPRCVPASSGNRLRRCGAASTPGRPCRSRRARVRDAATSRSPCVSARRRAEPDVPRFSRGLSRRLRLLRVGAVGQAE